MAITLGEEIKNEAARMTGQGPYNEKVARSIHSGPYGDNARLTHFRLGFYENLTKP